MNNRDKENLHQLHGATITGVDGTVTINVAGRDSISVDSS